MIEEFARLQRPSCEKTTTQRQSEFHCRTGVCARENVDHRELWHISSVVNQQQQQRQQRAGVELTRMYEALSLSSVAAGLSV